MFNGLFKDLTPSSFTSGRLLVLRRVIISIVGLCVFSSFFIIFGAKVTFEILAIFARDTTTFVIVMLYLLSLFIFLIGFKTKITQISIVTAWISEVQFLFLLFSPIWQMHAGKEIGFCIIFAMRILVPVLLAFLLYLYHLNNKTNRKYRRQLNTKK